MLERAEGLNSCEPEKTNVLAYRNYHRAIQWLDREANRAECVSEELFFSLHGICVEGILPENETGRYRTDNVRIVQAVVTPPDCSRVPGLMRDYVEDFKSKFNNCRDLPETQRINRAVEALAWGHYVFTRIHPFVDGNGRVIRLGCDFLCRKFNLRPIIWPKDRREYLGTIMAVDKSGNLDHLQLLLANLLRQRYSPDERSLTIPEVVVKLDDVIQQKKAAILISPRAVDFAEIWRGFSDPCFT